MKSIRTLPQGNTLNYFCTWASQYRMHEQTETNEFAKKVYSWVKGEVSPANAMNEVTLFSEGGLCEMYPELRSRLYLVIDDSWDHYITTDKRPLELSATGSFEVDEQRFPFTAGRSPEERLRMINERVKECGWRGVGIWISPQKCGVDFDKPFDPQVMREYWGERIRWCKYADVRYIKADWGRLSATVEARRLLTELGHEIFPELFIEQATPHGPFNGDIASGRFRISDNADIYQRSVKVAAFSDVFRSYDVSEDRLSAATTLERLDHLFKNTDNCFINCEDELYIGAALGCSVGIMRSYWGAGRFHYCRSLDEVTAAINWFDHAPSFAGGDYLASEELLADEHLFGEGEIWMKEAVGKLIKQYAPAIMARNTELPTVKCDGNKPYILASRNPSGAYSVAAVKRYMYYNDTAPAYVTCRIGDADKIGIFGSFGGLTFCSDKKVSKVLAVSLMGGESVDITASMIADGNTFSVDQKTLDSFMRVGDESENAVMLTLLRE